MNLVRCNKGHFYDGDRFSSCPHCGEKNQMEMTESAEKSLFDKDNTYSYNTSNNEQLNDSDNTSSNFGDPWNKSTSMMGLILPTELNDCEVINNIGRGALGDVFQIQRKIDYAVKVVDWKKPYYHDMAKREYEIAKLFDDSKNVINYLGYYEQDETSYILQELAEPWINYCSEKNITVGEVLNALINICEALLVIHKMGYQHYDINPKNIFIKDGVVKIGDFSHSSKIEKGKIHEHCIGTYQFIAPEILNYDICSGTEDIYSLGITMYVMLTGGELPYNLCAGRKNSGDFTNVFGDSDKNTSIESFIRHKEDVISTIFLNSELVGIIKKATSYEAVDRYQSVTEMIEDIQNFKKKYERSMNEIIRRNNSDDIHNNNFYNWNHNVTKCTMGSVFAEKFSIENDNNNLENNNNRLISPFDSPFDASVSVDLNSFEGKPTSSIQSPIDVGYMYSEGKGVLRDCNEAIEWYRKAADKGNPEALSMLNMYLKNGTEIAPSQNDIGCDNSLSLDSVRFSIITEKSVEKDNIGIIEVAMFTDEFESQVIDSIKNEFSNEILSLYSHYVDVNKNTEVTVQLQSKDIEIDEDTITYKWNGRYLKYSFDYYIPGDFQRKRALVKAYIYFNNVIAVTMKFVIDIVQNIVIDDETGRNDIKTAYMSYAREDINEATYILQGIKKARNDLDIFFDIENLRSGDDWQKKLYDELSKRDILFLCWSHYAAVSKWVEREVKYMLDSKGTDAIRPIPLEHTTYSDLPEALKNFHFNDIEILIRDAYSKNKNNKFTN